MKRIIVITLSLLIIFTFSGCSLNDNDKINQNITCYVGDTISFNQGDFQTYDFTVTEIGTGYKNLFSLYDIEPYLYVKYEVENTCSSIIYFNDYDILCYADGYSVDNIYVADRNYNTTYELSPGRKVQAEITFDTNPDAVNSLELERANVTWVLK